MKNLEQKAISLIAELKTRKYKMATAESCTGGLLSGVITSVSGSSEVFECGFVTYSNSSKNLFLNVPEKILAEKGAVSEEVAKIMAVSACLKCGSTLAVSITGIAGPNGGTDEKPVGTVYIGFYSRRSGKNFAIKNNFLGNREEVRKQSVEMALDIVLENL
jgi:PncC family amidohydrolase